MNTKRKVIILLLALLSGIGYSAWIGEWVPVDTVGMRLVPCWSTFAACLYGFEAIFYIVHKQNVKSNWYCLLGATFQIIAFTCVYKGVQLEFGVLGICAPICFVIAIVFLICSDNASKK